MPTPRAEEVSPESLGPRAGRLASRACVHAKSLQSCPTLSDSMDCSPPGSSVHGFSRQEYWSGLPCPPPRDLPDPGIEPTSLMSPALAGGFVSTSTTQEACIPCKSIYLGPLKEQEPAQGRLHVAHRPHAEFPGGKGWS